MSYTVRKRLLYLVLSCLLFFSFGCETISAFKEGQVNMQDVVQMTKTMPAEKPLPEKQPGESWMHKADMWTREILW